MKKTLNAAVAIGLAAAASIADSYQKFVNRSPVPYRSRKTATAKPKNCVAGNKLMERASNGMIGIRHNGLGPVRGVTINKTPKVKGPRFTRSVRGVARSNGRLLPLV